ncbi:MAG: XTP/dITP diphosphatase [Acidobacteriaceae bacterium]
MRIFVATSNAGKLRDFGYAAERAGAGVEIAPLPGLRGIPAPAEDEVTFEGNARVKALYYAVHAPGELVLADDSGLEVRRLEGAPGVRSARYAEDVGFPHAVAASVDERNNAALLRAMDGVPDSCREGRYRCALAAARDREVVATAEGVLEGTIITAPRGEAGFGYDPLFFVPELGMTMAEIGMEMRLELSHRGRALRRLLEGFASPLMTR